MFNLIMTGVEWSSGRFGVALVRMFEYTDDHIAAQFKDDGESPLFDRLIKLPCLFCNEGTSDEVARVGQINRVRIAGKEAQLEISLDPEVPPIDNALMHSNRYDLDIRHDFEFSRNHWAVKEVDLYRFMLRHVRPRRQRPNVFQLPEHEKIEASLASAMMPFAAEFNPVLEAIRSASTSVGLLCRRADDIWENAAIIQDVVALIDRSRIVVCDCTGRNPNVFYEAGIAHTLGRDVVLITQRMEDIPFDLRHLRHVQYLNNDQGLEALTRSLASRMRTLLSLD